MEPFDPPGEEWVRVSPRLAVVRRVSMVLGALPLSALVVSVPLVAGLPVLAAVVAVVAVAAVAWGWVLIGRSVASWGYAERADDLLITSGILNRQLVVVPYGRMQFVDVTAGPLDRRLNLATVQLHTAAASTDASIPGLEPAEAARLRDRLAARGEATAAGL